jgi:hypothetical protein
MSVAFHVRFEVPSLEASCGAGKAWATAVWDQELRRPKNKKEKRVKRIMNARLD